MTHEALTTCTLCEAKCGLTVKVVNGRVERIRGDRDDAFSQGFLCPKGTVLGRLVDDPDRLRHPLIRRDGELVETTWDEAFAEIARLIADVRSRHGAESIGFYGGNPAGFNFGAALFLHPLATQVSGHPYFYSAASVDQWPKNVACAHLFGHPWSIPLPDLERTDLLIVLGADPVVSGGSLAAASDWSAKLGAIRARGGRVIVIDPRRSATAAVADEWIGILPGTDALFLSAVMQVLVDDGLVEFDHLESYVIGFDQLATAVAEISPEAVAAACGIEAAVIRRVAGELARAPSAAIYGRIGTTLNPYGTLASWMVDALNIVTGNLDRPGGALFATAPFRTPTSTGPERFGSGPMQGRRHTRVRGLPEVMGQLPLAALAEEILTPGDGRLRGLVTLAGNPARSAPDSTRMEEALADLECLIALDLYVNETTRFAHVILPVPSPLQRAYVDVFLGQASTRSVAKYCPAVLARDPDMPEEWETMARVALIAGGSSSDAEPAELARAMIRAAVTAACEQPEDVLEGRDVDEILALLESSGRPLAEQLVDFLVRSGPFGDHFGQRPEGLALDTIAASPHGIDLGGLEPRLPGLLRTPSGSIDLGCPALLAEIDRMRRDLTAGHLAPEQGSLHLVGRRNLRSMNSWLHNFTVLIRGRPTNRLHMHPVDATRIGLADGGAAVVTAGEHRLCVTVEVTEAVSVGTVSLPHGWGHDVDGVRLTTARAVGGPNLNVLTSVDRLDPLSGTAVLNGIPVAVTPA